MGILFLFSLVLHLSLADDAMEALCRQYTAAKNAYPRSEDKIQSLAKQIRALNLESYLKTVEVKVDEKKIEGLVQGMDDNRYRVREKASFDLLNLGLPVLKSEYVKANLKSAISAEVYERLQRVYTTIANAYSPITPEAMDEHLRSGRFDFRRLENTKELEEKIRVHYDPFAVASKYKMLMSQNDKDSVNQAAVLKKYFENRFKRKIDEENLPQAYKVGSTISPMVAEFAKTFGNQFDNSYASFSANQDTMYVMIYFYTTTNDAKLKPIYEIALKDLKSNLPYELGRMCPPSGAHGFYVRWDIQSPAVALLK